MTVFGLSTFIYIFRRFCKVQGKYQANIRAALPAQHQATFDNLVNATNLFCTVLDVVDFVGDGNP